MNGKDSLTTLFRSTIERDILLELFVESPRELSVGEIVTRVRAPQPTVSREVARLERGGILRSRRVAQTKLVSPDPDLVFSAALRRLLVEARGTLQMIGAALAVIDQVEAAFVVGRSAEFVTEGRRPDSGELAVVVVGDPDLADLDGAVARIEEAIDLHLTIEVRLPAELDGRGGAFDDDGGSGAADLAAGLRVPLRARVAADDRAVP